MADTIDVICQLCQQEGQAALDCPHLEVAAAARSAHREGNPTASAVSGGAYAQLINYGTITINQVGGAGKHGRPTTLATLPATMSRITGPQADVLGLTSSGVKKHHHHDHGHDDVALDHGVHHHHHHHVEMNAGTAGDMDAKMTITNGTDSTSALLADGHIKISTPLPGNRDHEDQSKQPEAASEATKDEIEQPQVIGSI